MGQPTVLYPQSALGTQGSGVRQFADADGNVQAIPYTGTSPFGEPAMHPDGYELPYPVDPPIDVAGEDELLHEQMHGVPWHGYEIQVWVNPSNPGIPNLGPVNEQDFQSGHSQIVVHNPSAEQGWGLDPAILLPRFPHSENVNPFYARGTMRRNGQFIFTNAGLPFGMMTQQNVQALSAQTRQRSTVHSKLADVPAMVPYSATVVPVHGQAGPMNLVPAEDVGVY